MLKGLTNFWFEIYGKFCRSLPLFVCRNCLTVQSTKTSILNPKDKENVKNTIVLSKQNKTVGLVQQCM